MDGQCCFSFLIAVEIIVSIKRQFKKKKKKKNKATYFKAIRVNKTYTHIQYTVTT
jgi:hypothetical protein